MLFNIEEGTFKTIKPFLANPFTVNSLKTANLRLPDVFKRYKIVTLTRDGFNQKA